MESSAYIALLSWEECRVTIWLFNLISDITILPLNIPPQTQLVVLTIVSLSLKSSNRCVERGLVRTSARCAWPWPGMKRTWSCFWSTFSRRKKRGSSICLVRAWRKGLWATDTVLMCSYNRWKETWRVYLVQSTKTESIEPQRWLELDSGTQIYAGPGHYGLLFGSPWDKIIPKENTGTRGGMSVTQRVAYCFL